MSLLFLQKKAKYFLFLILLVGIILSGCTTNTENNEGENNVNIQQDIIVNPESEEDITIPNKTPKINYTVSVTIDSVNFSECIFDEWGFNSWTIVSQGTMTSNIQIDKIVDDYRYTIVYLSPSSTYKGITTDWGVYASDINCGEWKTKDKPGYYSECIKEEGDPDSTTWSLTYQHNGWRKEVVDVRAAINAYQGQSIKDEVIKSAGMCD